MRQNTYTLGQVAKRFGVKLWQVDRLFSRGFLPEPARVGILRILIDDDLPAVEFALRRAGYLAAIEEVVSSVLKAGQKRALARAISPWVDRGNGTFRKVTTNGRR